MKGMKSSYDSKQYKNEICIKIRVPRSVLNIPSSHRIQSIFSVPVGVIGVRVTLGHLIVKAPCL